MTVTVLPVGLPVPARLTREQYPPALSETPTLADPVHTSPRLPKKLSPTALISKYEAVLHEHLERRVQLMFLTLVAVWRTGERYQAGPTLHQGKSCSTLYTVVKGKTVKVSQRNAAHSSTLPSLLCRGLLFLEGTSFSQRQNATMELPRDVNTADIHLDGKPSEKALREKALKIVNEVASNTMTPEEGTLEFCAALKKRIVVKLEGDLKPGVKKTLEIYKEALSDVRLAVKQKGALAQWLDLPPTAPKAVRLARAQQVQAGLFAEMATVQKVEAVRARVFSALPARTVYKEEAFRHVVAQEVPEARGLWNLPPEATYAATALTTEAARTKYKKTKEAVQTALHPPRNRSTASRSGRGSRS